MEERDRVIKAQESILCYNSTDWLDASPKERLPCKGVPSSAGGTAGTSSGSRLCSGAGGTSNSAIIIMCN